MNDFQKICRLGTVRQYASSDAFMSVFINIKFKDGKLSITGVEGPTRNGDAKGSCGQITIDPEDKSWQFADGWTKDMLYSLNTAWKDWHLNDMRPYCQHQKVRGWREQAMREVSLYHWTLRTAIFSQQRAIKDDVLASVKKTRRAFISDIQQRILNLPLSMTTHENSDPVPGEYEPEKADKGYGKPPIEKKTLGWLTQKEHPNGLLGKKCPDCDHTYGGACLRDEVPAEVIAWLQGLPKADRAPAWI